MLRRATPSHWALSATVRPHYAADEGCDLLRAFDAGVEQP